MYLPDLSVPMPGHYGPGPASWDLLPMGKVGPGGAGVLLVGRTLMVCPLVWGSFPVSEVSEPLRPRVARSLSQYQIPKW